MSFASHRTRPPPVNMPFGEYNNGNLAYWWALQKQYEAMYTPPPPPLSLSIVPPNLRGAAFESWRRGVPHARAVRAGAWHGLAAASHPSRYIRASCRLNDEEEELQAGDYFFNEEEAHATPGYYGGGGYMY